jgi:hypothetical protein
MVSIHKVTSVRYEPRSTVHLCTGPAASSGSGRNAPERRNDASLEVVPTIPNLARVPNDARAGVSVGDRSISARPVTLFVPVDMCHHLDSGDALGLLGVIALRNGGLQTLTVWGRHRLYQQHWSWSAHGSVRGGSIVSSTTRVGLRRRAGGGQADGRRGEGGHEEGDSQGEVKITMNRHQHSRGKVVESSRKVDRFVARYARGEPGCCAWLRDWDCAR